MVGLLRVGSALLLMLLVSCVPSDPVEQEFLARRQLASCGETAMDLGPLDMLRISESEMQCLRDGLAREGAELRVGVPSTEGIVLRYVQALPSGEVEVFFAGHRGMGTKWRYVRLADPAVLGDEARLVAVLAA